MNLLEKVEYFSIKNNLIEKGDHIVLGVSGGPDSLCLLHILNCLKDKYNLKLTVAHVNHCLRPEADFEEAFVKKFCEDLDIAFFSKKVEISKLKLEEKRSAEEIARDIRYTFFDEILKRVEANKIAVAHNKNDNAETILMNIVRGCGTEGLSGISKISGKIVRPLLDTERVDIEEYCNTNNLTPMIDKTNKETVYTRNKIRNLVIPMLKEINPDVISSITRLGDIVSNDEQIMEKHTNEEYNNTVYKENGKIIIKKNMFCSLNKGLKRRILRRAILGFRDTLKDISFKTIDNAIREIEISQNGNIIKIANGVKIFANYDNLEIIDKKEKIKDYEYELKIPGRTYINEINAWLDVEIKNPEEVDMTEKNPNNHFFDIAKTGKKLYVRNRRNGDKFFPTGMVGKKKLKDFLSDSKVNIFKRDTIPVLTNGEDIIWLVGMRSSRKFLKDRDTKEVIIINYGENI